MPAPLPKLQESATKNIDERKYNAGVEDLIEIAQAYPADSAARTFIFDNINDVGRRFDRVDGLNLNALLAAVAQYPDRTANEYWLIGNIERYAERYADALQSYNRALALDTTHGWSYYSRMQLAGKLPNEKLDVDADLASAVKFAKGEKKLLGRCKLELASRAEEADVTASLPKYQEAVDEDPTNADAWYYYGLAQMISEDYQAALVCFETGLSVEPDPEEHAEFQFSIGQVYGFQKKIRLAVEHYNKALELNPHHVYAAHNLSLLYYMVGNYRQANAYCRQAFRIYSEDWERKTLEPVKCYYYADLVLDHAHPKTITTYELCEQLIQEYINENPASADGYALLFKCQAKKHRGLTDGRLSAGDTSQPAIEDTHFNMLNAFNRAEELLQNDQASSKAADGKITKPLKHRDACTELGSLYLGFGYHEQAVAAFQEAAVYRHEASLEGLGIANFRKGEFDLAIASFKEAIRLNPYALNLECNLGDAYRGAGKLDEAEAVYAKVMSKCPKYVDALIGVGECYKLRGDEALKAKENEDAESFFIKSREYFDQTFAEQTNDNASRRLTPAEDSALRYSSGYVKVRLYELGRSRSLPVLSSARADFKKVRKGSSHHNPATKAVKKINEKFLKIGPNLIRSNIVTVVAIALLITVQVVGYQALIREKKYFMLNKQELQKFAATLPAADKLDFENEFKPLLAEQFTSANEAYSKLIKNLNASIFRKLAADTASLSQDYEVPKLSETTYAVLTFGSLVLLIAGLFLPNLTTIKLAGIELVKNAVDTVKETESIIKP